MINNLAEHILTLPTWITLPLGRWVNHQHFDRAEAYLVERGGKAVFLGRFTAALRVMIPGLAGMSRMRYPTFVVYNVAGAVGWVMLSVTLGYAGGSSWRHVEHLASRIGLGALVVVLLGLTGGYLVRRSRSSGWAQRQTSRLRASRPATGAVRGFPAQVAWTRRRVDPTSPTGLPLTAAVLVALGAAWIFLGITQDVVAREELATLDPRIHLWVLQHRTGWLDTTMRAMTWLGANAVVVPMLAISAVLLCRIRHSWAPPVPIVAVYTACVLLHALVGDVVRRPRPTAADWLTGAGGWSYPSGHTIQATAAYGVLLVLLAEGTTPRVRRRLTLAAVVIVALVATSRVYLGVHWASDVFGSISLGTLVVSLAVITRLATRGTAGARPDPPGVPSPVHEEHAKGSGGLRVSMPGPIARWWTDSLQVP